MTKFEVGKIYTSKDFLGHECNYKCVRRTAKTITLYDDTYGENFVKKVNSTNETEYVTFSKEFMGYAEMNVYASQEV